jgi:uncharacterized membrane protein YoaK (UPF0700 family)
VRPTTSLATAVVTVMSVQPTSEKFTVLHCAGSAAWVMTGRLNSAANNTDRVFHGSTPGVRGAVSSVKPYVSVAVGQCRADRAPVQSSQELIM